MSMGTRIRECRKAAGWSQAKLSDESGISQQMLSKLERGVAFGTTEIVHLARALKVSPKWLETGDGSAQDGELADDERELLEGYRSMPPPEKAAVLTLIARGRIRPVTGAVRAIVSDQPQRLPAYPSQERRVE